MRGMQGVIAAVLVTLMLVSACGSSAEPDDAGCVKSEVEVVYLGVANERTVCHPIPAACGTEVKCGDLECDRALYALCEAPAVGVGCSDTFQPAIVSCNE